MLGPLLSLLGRCAVRAFLQVSRRGKLLPSRPAKPPWGRINWAGAWGWNNGGGVVHGRMRGGACVSRCHAGLRGVGGCNQKHSLSLSPCSLGKFFPWHHTGLSGPASNTPARLAQFWPLWTAYCLPVTLFWHTHASLRRSVPLPQPCNGTSAKPGARRIPYKRSIPDRASSSFPFPHHPFSLVLTPSFAILLH